MADIRELYQEMILEHNRTPRNFKKIENADQSAEGYNPLCGDRLKIYLTLEGDVIKDIGFQGSGCAISKASASMMTVSVKGKRKDEVQRIFKNFHSMLLGNNSNFDTTKVGKLAVFSGVREFPARVKCATLSWHTLNAGLEGIKDPVSTERDGGGEGA